MTKKCKANNDDNKITATTFTECSDKQDYEKMIHITAGEKAKKFMTMVVTYSCLVEENSFDDCINKAQDKWSEEGYKLDTIEGYDLEGIEFNMLVEKPIQANVLNIKLEELLRMDINGLRRTLSTVLDNYAFMTLDSSLLKYYIKVI